MSLTAYIKQDLKSRFRSGSNAPEKLTLFSLSEHYGVSLTPIRLVVRELIDEGIIRKGSNGRLSFDKKNAASIKTTEIVERPPTADDWNRTLMEDIMLASLEGEAVYLREKALVLKYKIGRSVIRQTFNRLAGAGLLEHVPRCGWLVSPLRKEKVHAYLQIREALELTALDLAQPNFSNEDLEKMLDDNRIPDNGEAPLMDNRLHIYLIEKSGNEYIRAFFGQHLSNYYSMLFDYAAPETSVVAEMAGQHRQILEALLERQLSSARHTLSAHIWAQEGVLSKLLERVA